MSNTPHPPPASLAERLLHEWCECGPLYGTSCSIHLFADEIATLERELTEARAKNDGLRRKADFAVGIGECGHERRYWRQAQDDEGDSYDACALCEAAEARAALAEAVADSERLSFVLAYAFEIVCGIQCINNREDIDAARAAKKGKP